jgi:hypothetical protein
MTSDAIRRAKLARKFGMALALAGLVPIAWFIAATFHPVVPSLPISGTEDWLPASRVPWIAHPAALLFALASLALMWLGGTIVARQNAVFEAHRKETEDRLRRVREYGSDGRIEPYIGSDLFLRDDKEPS